MRDTKCRVLSIEAWRGPDGGWIWNQWYDTGCKFPLDLIDSSPREVLAYLRGPDGPLSAHSAGQVALEDDGYNLVIVAKGTREPVFAIEYGPLV